MPVYDIVITTEAYTPTRTILTATLALSVTMPKQYNAFIAGGIAFGGASWDGNIRLLSWKAASSTQYRAPKITFTREMKNDGGSMPINFVYVTLQNDGNTPLQDVYAAVWTKNNDQRWLSQKVTTLLMPGEKVSFEKKLILTFPVPLEEIRVAAFGTVSP